MAPPHPSHTHTHAHTLDLMEDTQIFLNSKMNIHKDFQIFSYDCSYLANSHLFRVTNKNMLKEYRTEKSVCESWREGRTWKPFEGGYPLSGCHTHEECLCGNLMNLSEPLQRFLTPPVSSVTPHTHIASRPAMRRSRAETK